MTFEAALRGALPWTVICQDATTALRDLPDGTRAEVVATVPDTDFAVFLATSPVLMTVAKNERDAFLVRMPVGATVLEQAGQSAQLAMGGFNA